MKELKTAAVILSLFTLFTITACGAKAKTAQTLTLPETEQTTSSMSASETEQTSAPGQNKKENELPEAAAAEKEKVVNLNKPAEPLTGAPPISLADVLSSSMEAFEVKSGSYSWSYLDKKETISLVACGMAPLDEIQAEGDKLHLSDSNQADTVPYLLSCQVPPDQLMVKEWDIEQLGDMEAEANSTVTYTEAFMIDMKRDKVYEITASWKQENLEEVGFYGEASYVVITE